MRSLRSLFVPVLAGTFVAATAAIPAMAQDNGYYDNGQAGVQQQNGPQNYGGQPNDHGQAAPQGNDQPYGPSYEGGSGVAQPQDQGSGQYNGTPPPPPPPDQLDSEDPGRAAVQQVDSAPPPFPVDAYDQPSMPGDGYEWTPGYWGWDDGWDWTPGVWAYPPYVGALWTPGYWGWGGAYYGWYPGYWGLNVGFYGGIYYGCGYWGRGFDGGRWDHDHYYNNRNVNNIRNTSFHTYNGNHGPGGFNGRQFHSAGNAGGAAGHGATNGRGAMDESVARTSSYGSVRGGGVQNTSGRGFNAATNRSYGNSMARRSGGGFGGASPTRAYNLPRGGSSFAGQQNYGSRGSYGGSSRGYSGGGFSGARSSGGGFSGSSGGFHGGGGGFSGGGGGFHGGGGGGFHGGGGGGGGHH